MKAIAGGAGSAALGVEAELAEIAASRRGVRQIAFFDLDGTVINGYSAVVFLQDELLHRRISPLLLARGLRIAAEFQLGRASFADLLAVVTEAMTGHSEDEFTATGQRLFADRIGGRIYAEARALIEAHRRRGHTIVICSSATRYQVAPVAADLGVEHVLCTELEVVDGRFTGEVVHNRWNDGKATAAVEFARARRCNLADAWFYSDGPEDVALLELVGRPRAVNPQSALVHVAEERGWPVLRFTSRGRPSFGDRVRTGLLLTSAAPSFALAVPPALMSGNWQSFVNLAMSTWGDLGTALAGITLRVQGEEHLWEHRPAVFIFNHQSYVDLLILMKLIRRDLTGVAKKELRHNPVVGPIFRIGGVAFIDRSDRVQSVAALHEVVSKLESGLSVAIAPEGTRSPTPNVQQFKKGAFRMAMEAGVPVVPIVIRNAGEVLARGASTIRPGTIDVAVLAPISVSDWTVDDLDDRIAEVHAAYVGTIARWPDPTRRARAASTTRARARARKNPTR